MNTRSILSLFAMRSRGFLVASSSHPAKVCHYWTVFWKNALDGLLLSLVSLAHLKWCKRLVTLTHCFSYSHCSSMRFERLHFFWRHSCREGRVGWHPCRANAPRRHQISSAGYVRRISLRRPQLTWEGFFVATRRFNQVYGHKREMACLGHRQTNLVCAHHPLWSTGCHPCIG